MSGYCEALQAAGAEVLSSRFFGDYQGTWLARVKYKGKEGWVRGYFGSCSYCDPFEAEFDYFADEQEDYQERLANFGKSYLDSLWSTKELLAEFEKDAEWDMEAEELVNFLRNY